MVLLMGNGCSYLACMQIGYKLVRAQFPIVNSKTSPKYEKYGIHRSMEVMGCSVVVHTCRVVATKTARQ